MEIPNKDLLIIFTRNIELGKCKTRLAKTVGPQIALEIYKFLVSHTVVISKPVKAHKWVFYSEYPDTSDSFDNDHYSKFRQEGADLGERMNNAFEAGFQSGYGKIIIIGSDIYDLNEKDLQAAFKALDQKDYVIGRAQDGGYYLLGMKEKNSAVFKNKAWGTASVFEDTLKDLSGEELTILPIRNDVDIYDDIKDVAEFQRFLIDWKK